jgi:hypothetical protein
MSQPSELAADIDAMFTQPKVIPTTRPGSWEPRGTRAGPLSGWHTWHVWNAGHGAEVVLRSPFMNRVWRTAAARHECSRHGIHTVPQPGCREGIYMFTTVADAASLAITHASLMDLVSMFGFDLTYVVGQLSTPGPVNEHFNHDLGFGGASEWIAQEVRIEALYIWPNFCSITIQPLAHALTELYTVPVKVLPFDDEIDARINQTKAATPTWVEWQRFSAERTKIIAAVDAPSEGNHQ